MNEVYIKERFVRGPYGFNYVYTPVLEEIYREKSVYQDIWIVKTPFGRTLVLDGIIQLTEFDEKIYHEALVKPAYKKRYRNILILGGGDGGAAREVTRLGSNIKVTVVDIDPKVTEAILKYIPEVPDNVFEKNDVNLINADAWEFVENQKEKYDYILVDLTDVREEDYQVNRFYKSRFLKKLKEISYEDTRILYFLGLYPVDKDIIMRFLNENKNLFKYYRIYGTYIPSFGGIWTYIALSDKPIRLNRVKGLIDLMKIDPDLKP